MDAFKKPIALDYSNDITRSDAIKKIKSLELRREKPFLDKAKVRGIRYSDLVEEAAEYKKRERDFLISLQRMKVPIEPFLNRMKREDLKQLQVEAELKADEAKNVLRNNEEKMSIMLTTLPFINQASKLTLKSRARRPGSNIDSLIEEAKKLNESVKQKVIEERKNKFMTMLMNVDISNENKKQLQNIIDEKTNLNQLKKSAISNVRQELIAYLTPLKVNRVEYLRRFNQGEKLENLKRDVRSDERLRFSKSLNTLNLQPQDKNRIMRSYDDGERNLSKLMNEAKNMKRRRDALKLNTEKQRLRKLAKGLNININLTNLSDVPRFENRIRTMATNKLKGELMGKVQQLSRIATNMNLDAQVQSDILRIKNNNEYEITRARVLDLSKKKLYERSKNLQVNFSSNIERATNMKSLQFIRDKIDAKGVEKKRAIMENLNKKRKNLKAYIDNIKNLSLEKRRAFKRQVNKVENLEELKEDINVEVERTKQNQKDRDLEEIKQYIQSRGLNTTPYIQRFKNSTIPMATMKAIVNKDVANKNKIKEVEQRGIKVNKNVDRSVRQYIDKGKNALSNTIIRMKMNHDLLDKVTAIKTLANLEKVQQEIDSISRQMKNDKNKALIRQMESMGFSPREINNVLGKKLPFNKSQNVIANMAMDKMKVDLTIYFDQLGVPVSKRKMFYEELNRTKNVRKVKNDVMRFIQTKPPERPVTNIRQILNMYNLKSEDKADIIRNWNKYSNMTISDVKNRAGKRSAELKKEKGDALLSYLKTLNLSNDDVKEIMQNFDANPKNTTVLRMKALRMKNLAIQEKRLKSRAKNANVNMNININTERDVVNINQRIDAAYITKAKQELSKAALNKNIDISNDLERVQSMNDVKRVKSKLERLVKNKNRQELNTLERAVANLSQNDKVRFLNQLKSKPLKNILAEIEPIKERKKRDAFFEKIKKYDWLDENDINTVMTIYDTTKDPTKAINKVKQLRKNKVAEDRKQLEKELNGMNLNVRNKKAVLNAFNKRPGLLEVFKANAVNRAEKRKREKIEKDKQNLNTFLNSLGLSNKDREELLKKPQNVIREEALKLKKTRDGEKLESIMSRLDHLPEKSKVKLRSDLDSGKKLKNVVANAKRRSLLVKSKKNVIDYIQGRNVSSAEKNTLIKQFKEGTIGEGVVRKRIREIEQTTAAQALLNKKEKVRGFLKNTNSIQEQITTLDKKMKSRREMLRKKQQPDTTPILSETEKSKPLPPPPINTSMINLQIMDTSKNKNTLIQFIKNSKISNAQKQRYLKQLNKSGTNIKALGNLVKSEAELSSAKNEMVQLVNKEIALPYRFQWKGIIDGIKTIKRLEEIKRNLSAKILLRNEIKQSKIGPVKRQGHILRVTTVGDNVNRRRRIFMNDVKGAAKSKPVVETPPNKKPVVETPPKKRQRVVTETPPNKKPVVDTPPKKRQRVVNETPPNKKPVVVKPPSTERPAVTPSPRTMLNIKRSKISAINKLRKIPQSTKTMYKRRLETAKTVNNYNRVVAEATKENQLLAIKKPK